MILCFAICRNSADYNLFLSCQCHDVGRDARAKAYRDATNAIKIINAKLYTMCLSCNKTSRCKVRLNFRNGFLMILIICYCLNLEREINASVLIQY